ncbi:probable leucine-rich repeat receptor-like protein kinase At5g05160 [Papaver somniferum]|uniref:probable leucine-rich repeat receptor-like protein kinase At5g05160 n=1 Tax=Papaver somniferum TaxID=3469 RepID=UPI000E6FA587|nr:probable leucine-rich repeat receptor-like protein kinase At5g05160 [Papaver somniferum]
MKRSNRLKTVQAGSLWITIFVIVDILAFFVLLSLACVCINKKKIGKEFQGKNKNKKVDAEAVPAEEKEKKLKFMESGGVIFELNDLLKASAEGLGKGNYGNSFKATLDNGLTVVVKRLTELKPLSSEEFATQMKLISGLKHRNLLPLLAYYYSKDEKLLLYKFIPKGNLYNRIHVEEGITGFLSNGIQVAAQRMISYKSPEYQNRRKITKKSDVWSYGCLLLDLLTGQICTYTAPQGSNDGVDLCSWAYRAVREEWTCEIFDMEMLTQRNAGQGMVRLLQLALKCCDKAPEKWPEMAEVAREVEDIKLNDDNDEFSFERSGSTDVSTSAL